MVSMFLKIKLSFVNIITNMHKYKINNIIYYVRF